ncbi:MAG: BamA/TamA family outer membrane protein [Rhodocyclaceae bacterium]
MGVAQTQKTDSPLFVDADDGGFDMSEWLLDKRGFLPVPIIITEPAVGYGGGVALMFVSESIRDAATQGAKTGHVTPPNIYVGGMAATENGSGAGFLGGMLSFAEDRWRYRGGVAKLKGNLDFYGIGNPVSNGEFKIGYTVKGFVSSQQILRRLGSSNNYLALRWLYMDLDTSLHTDSDSPWVPSSMERARRMSGAGFSIEHDSRDNIFTPSKGWTGSLDTLFYGSAIGSDNRMQSYRAHVFAYFALAPKWVLGTRVDGRAARGDVPFYQQPYIDMRGIAAGRYQDQNVGVGELELRWNVTPRWALVGFAGAAKAWGRHDDFGQAATVVSKGIGFRYLIARRLGMYVGVDIAKGPEDTPFYIQVGNAWH